MPGFVGFLNTNDFIFPENKRSDLLVNKYQDSLIYAETRWINKFLNDKTFYHSDHYLVMSDGVIFNLQNLLIDHKCNDLGQLCEVLYELKGEKFFNCFRGSFSGLIWDKRIQKLILFNDQIGDKPIFFSIKTDSLIFGTEFDYLIECSKVGHYHYTLNETAAWQMITFGFLLEDTTFAVEIKKLCAGQYLVWSEGKCSVQSYHRFNYLPDNSNSESEIIDRVDRLFQNAIELQINKNKEYGYMDIAPLSAGMDTRMVNYCIRKIKEEPILNFTYSQSGFFDQLYAEKIANELKNSWILKTANHGFSLYNIDKSVRMNGGHMAYYGVAVVDDIFSCIAHQNIGIVHTGLRGSGTISTYNPGKINNRNFLTDAFSTKLSSQIRAYVDVSALYEKYQYLELFTLYNSGFSGLNMGSPKVFSNYTESYSPFLDVDFLEYCLTIPFERRYENQIYDAWMLAKYPEAARFMHNGTRYIGGEKIHKRKPLIPFGKRYYSICEIPRLIALSIMRKVGLIEKIVPDQGIESPYNVAPLGYWINTNTNLRNYCLTYFNLNIDRLSGYPELKKEIISLYESGNGMEKNQVLTVLAILRNYFAEE